MKLSEFDFRIWNDGKYDEIELWTGLYDEKGKKIYEGDILKVFDDEEVTAYYEVSIDYIKGIELQNIDHLAISHIDNIFPNIVWGDYLSDTEVVGNIHKNVDLLKTIRNYSNETTKKHRRK